jgi:hypothetical protein
MHEAMTNLPAPTLRKLYNFMDKKASFMVGFLPETGIFYRVFSEAGKGLKCQRPAE